MKVNIVRHAETDATRQTKDDFGPLGAPLNGQGRISAQKLHKKLAAQGVDFSQSVAVSELQRTQQTAIIAGFNNLVVNPLLNEIDGGDPDKIDKDIAQRISSEFAIKAARKLLENPPTQKYWFTHGQLTAALLDLLGYGDREHYELGHSKVFEIEL